MRVAFIDDDPNELKILHTYFNDLTDPSTISIDDFSSGEEFLSRFTAGLYTRSVVASSSWVTGVAVMMPLASVINGL